MNLIRRFFLHACDPLLKKCFWQRFYQKDTQKSNSPAWLNQLMYCDCVQAIQRYQSTEAGYSTYLWQHSFLSCIEKRQRQRTVKYWQYKPLISIQLPVYKVDPEQLRACLDSVARQLYPHWQLCIVEDGGNIPAIRDILNAFKCQFPDQVKLVLRDDNRGITATSQELFTLTDGEYIALLDHDDYLAPEALYEVVKLLNSHPETDWIYSDNDKIDSAGRRCCLHAKPAWSPELLLTYNYILHLSVIRRTLIQQAGGFRMGFEGSQDHDLYLRLSELTHKIRHIPRILYSWRQSENSVALNPENKHYAFMAALRALNDALKRRHENGRATFPRHSWLGSYQIIRHIDKPVIDVIFLDTNAIAPSISHHLYQQTAITIKNQFYLAKKANAGNSLQTLINHCHSPYLLLLSPDLQFTRTDQLFNLAAGLAPSGVVINSAKIINNNDKVDHCGLAYQSGQLYYPLRGWDKNLDGIGAYGALPRNISIPSPLISLCKTKEIQTITEKLCSYQNISAWLIALSFELQAKHLRISVDGGIAMLYMPPKFCQITLSDHDISLLRSNYPRFFSHHDPLFHHQMKG